MAWTGPNADPLIIDYYPQTCAYDATALLKHLNVDKVIPIGHSQVIGQLVYFFELSYPADAPEWQKTWHVRRAREMDEYVLYAAA
ncbi:hypothetical protein OQA88_6097 [Cercophora sp. LCS_1]